MNTVEKDCGMCCGSGAHGMYRETCESCDGTGKQTYDEKSGRAVSSENDNQNQFGYFDDRSAALSEDY